MGTSLSGLTPATTFDGLLKVGDNDPLTADLKAISDGSGNDSAIQLSTGELKVLGQFNLDSDTSLTTMNLRGDSLVINQIYQANETTYNAITMTNSAGIQFKNLTNTTAVIRSNKFGLGIGGSTDPSATAHIKGSGATSATTSLLVQNSAGDDYLKVTDDGNVQLGSSISVQSTGISAYNSIQLKTFIGGGVYESGLIVTGNGAPSKVGIGETTPTARLHVKGSGNDATTTALLVGNSDGTTLFSVKDSGYVDINPTNSSDGSFKVRGDGADNLLFVNANDNYVGIGGTQSSSAVRAYIEGKGATSATTSLLVENSAGTDLFKVLDDGNVQVAEYIYPADGTTNSRLRVSNSAGTYMYYSTGNLKLNPNLVYTSTTYGTVFSVSNSTGDFSLNGAAGAKMAIKGNGNDATTTALLVQNSDGTDLFDITDNGEVEVKSGDFRIPSYKSIYGGGSSTYAITLEGTAGMNFKSWAKDFIFNTQNGTIATLKNDGKFGLGETNPTAKLQVKGSGNDNTTTALLVQNSDGADVLRVMDGGADKVLRTSSAQIGSLEFAGANIGRGGGNPITFAGTNQIGIGVSTPTSKLHIQGSGNDATTTALLVQNSDGTDMLSVKDDLSVVFNSTITSASSTLRFDVGGVGTIRMNSDKVAIGGNTTPTARLHVKGSGATSATTALLVQNSAGTEHLKVTDDGMVNVRSELFVNHPSISSRYLGLSWGAIGTNSTGDEFSLYGGGGNNGSIMYLNGSTKSAAPQAIGMKTTGVLIAPSMVQSSFAPNDSAQLQVDSTTKGFLPPRMTDAERDAIATPAAGLMIYDTTNNQMNYWNGSTWIAF